MACEFQWQVGKYDLFLIPSRKWKLKRATGPFWICYFSCVVFYTSCFSMGSLFYCLWYFYLIGSRYSVCNANMQYWCAVEGTWAVPVAVWWHRLARPSVVIRWDTDVCTSPKLHSTQLGLVWVCVHLPKIRTGSFDKKKRERESYACIHMKWHQPVTCVHAQLS